MSPQDVLATLQSSLAGRYDIDRKIGAGGMATVYLARDVKHDRHVALKLLDPELGAVLGAERFLSEIKVTANLQHPNLLPLFDSGEAGGLLFYVMPYVEGESLRARLDREKQLPVDEAVRIASAVASALDYAHRRGVIHRDLKPENILIHEGQPLVADFGIALAVSNAGGNRITQTGLSLGTPQYMSPEQATGDRVIDGRSDIYSLGAVLYEMLTGDPPHTGSSAQAIIARILTDKPRGVRLSRESVSPQVEFAIDKALAKLPADRWATAKEFEEALHGRGAAGAITSAGTTQQAAAPPASTPRARVRALLPWALAVLGAAGSAWGWSAAHREIPRPVIRFNLAFSDSIVPVGGAGTSTTISPDGRVVAFLGRSKGHARQLYLRTLDDMRTREVPGTDDAQQPFFSPDSRWLGFWADNKLQKVLVDGGSTLELANLPLPLGVSWSRSGVIVLGYANGLATLPEGGGTPRVLATRDSASGETSKRWPVVLQDGKTVLYTSARTGMGEPKLGKVSLDGGPATAFDVTGTFPMGVVDGALVYASMSGSLMAVPFDIRRGRITGDPTPVVPDVVVGSGGAAKAGLSLDGTLVYERGVSTNVLGLMGAQGTVRALPLETKGYAWPRYSPDGRRIAVTIRTPVQSDVWIHDLASGTTSRLIGAATQNDRPEWSPDGKRVISAAARSLNAAGGSSGAGASADAELWWQPSDLTGTAERLADLKGVTEGVISPDGRTLVYRTLKSDIMYRSLVGDTTSKPIATTTFAEVTPRLSPDGRWVAYASNESGVFEVFVQPFPGPGPRTQVSTGTGAEPVWARDGRRLFYRNNAGFMIATYATVPGFTVVSRTPFGEEALAGLSTIHATYDVAPDGARLLVTKLAGSPQTIVVHNWSTELKARLAPRKPQ